MEYTDKELKEKVKRGKRTRYVRLAIILLALVSLVFGFKEYRDRNKISPDSAEGIVTIEIRCDQLSEDIGKLNDQSLAKYVPEDGLILKGEYPVSSGYTTVFDITDKACKDNDIQIEYSYTAGYGGYYIEGINYLYEFSAGKYSGWLFTIDGESPSYGADKITLKGGEHIVWNYTVDFRID